MAKQGPVIIDGARMREKFDTLSQIGASENGGLSRLALTAADKQARDLFVSWLKEAGLTVANDDGGNIYGHRQGAEPDRPAILMGSHLDTVFQGGRFDGITGVMGALEVMNTLKSQGIKTKRPVSLAVFTNEEGARFQPALLGSGLLTGHFSKDYVYSRQDKEGKIFAEELKNTGYMGAEKDRIKPPGAYLELHIEQGPVLDAEKLSVGVVEGILAMTWYQVTITGQADHAGPTPMPMRHDALVAAARIVHQVRELAHILGQDSVTTVGQFKVEPSIVNVIPGKVTFTVDIRNARDAVMEQGIEALKNIVARIADEEEVEYKVSEMWRVNATLFDTNIVNTIESEVQSLGYPYRRITSGAGHDAQYMAKIVPTGMIFVPSVGGKSHTESELTTWADIERGTQVLLNTVLKLANS